MKKICLLVLLLAAMAGRAQTFEGIITWSIKYEMTDPVKQAEMEKSMKAMSDPANQEKMKKMQEQMNTPEMKAVMEKNPQMKTQMESAMKMMQGGSGGSMLPRSFIVKSNGSNSLTKMEGGMMAMETLYLKDKNQAYLLDRSAKTYTPLQANTSTAARKMDSMQHKVIKTSETMTVLNYTCTKYVVELTQNGHTAQQYFWTTTDIKGLDMRNFYKQKMGNSGQALYYEGIAGVPLRMEMLTQQMNVVMEVTGIKKETLSGSDFTIPPDFREVKGLYGMPPAQ